MSLSIDKDPAEEGEDARGVLASWLDDYISGRCDRADMQESFLSVCRSNPDAPWDALALLDQYQRRGRIDMTLARSLKTDIAQLVFGVANQTEEDSPDGAETPPDASADTTGSRWRKLIEERDAEAITAHPPRGRSQDPVDDRPAASDRDHSFMDPTMFRRDLELTTRPPPVLNHRIETVAGRTVAASDTLRDRYELLSILGRGSSGTVYKALDRHRAHLSESARCVAVKVLKLNYQDRPEALAELEREFHQAQLLSHPNIVSVFDLDRDGDTYFIVMELLQGELLADILRRLGGRPMPREQALAIVGSVGAALAHAHRRDIVHADLKPRNVMITRSGEIRVLDFGFARNRPLELHSASALHDTPVPAPAYASVERVNSSEPHSSDDVYSLACIAYELLSGQHPFGGRSAVLARAHGRHPRRIAGLSHKQSQALQRALLWTRGERKIDVVELLSALGCADTPNRLVPPEDIVPDPGRSWRLRVIAMAAFVLLAVGAAAYLYNRPESLPSVSGAVPVTPPQADREKQASATPEPAAAQASSNPPAASRQQDTTAGKASKVAEAPAGKSAEVMRGRPAATKPAAAAPAQSASRPGTPASPATIEFDKDTYVATESDGAVQLRVRRSGSTQRPVTFRWTLRGNSAEAGTDFAAIGPDTEQIPAGAREATVIVPLVSDSVIENTELFLVEIEAAQDGVSLGERSNAAVIVVDDD